MRIRVTGTITQVDVFIDRLRRSNLVIITSVSKWCPWTRHDPSSKLGSRYVDFELDVDPLVVTPVKTAGYIEGGDCRCRPTP